MRIEEKRDQDRKNSVTGLNYDFMNEAPIQIHVNNKEMYSDWVHTC